MTQPLTTSEPITTPTAMAPSNTACSPVYPNPPRNVRTRQSPKTTCPNVGSMERALSLAGAAALAAFGVERRNWSSFLAAGAGAALLYRGLTGRCHLYQALGVNTDQPRRAAQPAGLRVVQSFLIGRSPEQLYSFWRTLENLPLVMSHLKSVQALDGTRSHWVAYAPALVGGEVEWDAQITEDVPNSRIAWRSLPGSTVDSRGVVEFIRAPGTRGTAVHVTLQYDPPAGRFGRWIAKLLGDDPQATVREDLRRFKRAMEIGEVISTEGQPRGACFAKIGKLMQ